MPDIVLIGAAFIVGLLIGAGIIIHIVGAAIDNAFGRWFG